jgi:hypothetical protein
MQMTLNLWLPILLSAVAIFIASSLIHMVLKWHNADYRKLANEDEVGAALRNGSPTPGQYVLPYCLDHKEMGSEAMQKKFNEGPIGLITIRANGMPSMGKSLSQWFVYCLIIAAITGSIARSALGPTPVTGMIACVVGTTSFLAFTGGSVQMGIWMGKPWRSVLFDAFDGVIYATICALMFSWLWV